MIQQPASSSYQQVLFSHVSRHLFSALSHWSIQPNLGILLLYVFTEQSLNVHRDYANVARYDWYDILLTKNHENKQNILWNSLQCTLFVRAKSTCGHNRASRRCCRAVISESRLWITATWWDFRGRCRYLIFMHELITNVYQWELLTFFVNSGWPWKKYGVFFACKWLNWFIGFNSCITSAWLVTLKGHLKISGSWRFEICSWCSKSTFRVPVWKSSAM